jgi:hypothetical protein
MSNGKLGGSLLDDVVDAPAQAVRSETSAGGRASTFANWKLWLALGLAVVAAGVLWAQKGKFESIGASTRYIAAIDASDPNNPVPLPEFYAPEGVAAPYKSSKTGAMAVWPAEKCFWTREGKAKLVPTLVLLNSYVNNEGETLCPDCNRRVVPRNPAPPEKLMLEALEAGRKN